MDLFDIDKFRDPIWRISNLYSIRTRDGKVIPFRPRPQQAQVLEMIFKKGLKDIVIPKARQLGFSTLLGVICTDRLCCEDLRRSEEILTGAIPSAKDGTIVVETTWRGGRGGHLWIS
jgi:hypothetical protein